MIFHKTLMWQLDDGVVFDSVETAVDYINQYWDSFVEKGTPATRLVSVNKNSTSDTITVTCESDGADSPDRLTININISPVTVIVE